VRRIDELATDERQCFGADDPGDGRPGRESKHEDDAVKTGAEQRDDDHGQEKARHDLHGLGATHQEIVDATAAITSHRADPDAEDRRDGNDREHHRQRGARAMHDA
jgi:hypothetical protein